MSCPRVNPRNDRGKKSFFFLHDHTSPTYTHLARVCRVSSLSRLGLATRVDGKPFARKINHVT